MSRELHIETFVVGPIATNTYVVVDPKSQSAVVVDPGLECEEVLAAASPYRLQHILLTHAHFDHIGGVAKVHQRTDARVWIHSAERHWLADPTLNLSVSEFCPEPVIAPGPHHEWEDGQVHEFLSTPVKVLHTPGHSPGHVSLLFGDVLIGGDALFAGSVGRTDLPGGDHAQLMQSIAKKLLTLPDATRVLPGHGPPTTIGEERATNPFLNG